MRISAAEENKDAKVKGPQDRYFLDYLIPGSCLNVFTAFSDELETMVNYTAITTCYVDVIDANELRALRQSYLALSDIFTRFESDLEAGRMTDLDFFRPRSDKTLTTNQKKRLIKKFKKHVISCYKALWEDGEPYPPALETLK